MAGMTSGPTPYSPTLNLASTQLPNQARQPEINKTYRQDSGLYMTDADYTSWKQQQPIKAQQASSDIQSAAQKGLMGAQGDIASKAATQQAGIASSAATQGEMLAEKQATAEAALQSQAEQRRLGEFQSVFSSTGGGGGSSLAPIDYGAVTGQEDAANNAAFARAKDIAGNTGRAALNSLSNVMGARGLTGSGLAVNQAGGVIGEGARQLGDVNREQMIQSQNIARQRASEQYQGGIAQRAQDVSQRGQNLSVLQGLMQARY